MKKFLALFLTALLLLAPMTIFAVGATSNKDINEEKITDELKEVMADKKNNEYIPIYIWLYDLGDEVVYSRLSNKLGKSLNQYNEGLYIEENVKNKVDKFNKKQKEKKNNNQKFDASVFREEAEIGETLTNEEIENCIDAGKTTEQIIELSERYQYLSDFRNSRVEINASVNEIFEKSINRAKCKNVYVDSALSLVRMECRKSYIYEIANSNMVTEIGYYYEKTMLDAETTTDESSDRYDMNKFSNLDYNGYGIRIGVIETSSKYDIRNPHLSNRNINIVNGSTTQNDATISHPTAVLSVLCGSEVNGYSGVATGATIYFAGGADTETIMEEYLETLVLDKGVSIVNMSFEGKYIDYNTLDQYIDCFVAQYRTIIVIAVGNNGDFVTSPALAFNAISVGNVSNMKDNAGNYKVSSTSRYNEIYTYSTEKPDISAFGTNVYMYEKNTNGATVLNNYGSGTSMATPIVAGTIALMLDANSDLIGKPDSVKAILLNSANSSNISETENNSIVATPNKNGVVATSQLKNKSGAGLVNVEGAINMAVSNVLYRYSVSSSSTTEEASFIVDEFYFEKDREIEFTLVFEKNYHDIPVNLSYIKTDFDVEDFNSNGTKILWTNSSVKNNIECVEMKIPADGNYTFKIKCNILEDDGDPCGWHDNINISFLLSCGCDLPSANISNCVNEGHDIICDNCGLLCQETHMHATETQYYSDVTIKYDVYYKIRQFNYDVNDIICFFDPYPQLTPTNSANRAIYIQDMSYTEFQLYKRWDLLNFEIVIFSPTNEVVANFYSTLYVNIYYSTRECEFDTTV